MRWDWNQLSRVARWIVALLILGAVAAHFGRLLSRPELWETPVNFQPAWILGTLSGYTAAFTVWGAFWGRLLRANCQAVTTRQIARAYFVSQLGKYVPGKALAIILRVLLIRRAGVRPEVAAITATFETLTVMASGAALAAVLLAFTGVASTQDTWKILGLLLLIGIPLLPSIFNRVAARAARPFLAEDAPLPPRLRLSDLIGGLIQTSFGWFLLGLSLLMLLRAFGEQRLSLLTCTASVAFSYVAGFLTLPAPGGLGVREALLQQFLAGRLSESWGEVRGEALAAVVALTLRFWWTLAEVGLAAAFYALIREKPRG